MHTESKLPRWPELQRKPTRVVGADAEHGPVALEGHRLDCSTSWTSVIFLKETLAFVPQQELSPEQPPANLDLAPIRSFAFPFTYILKAGSYVTGTSLTFATYAKMTLSFTFPCFCLSSAGITGTVSSYLQFTRCCF